ncbi:MAG TPA: adenylate/guanylate cyclase domain-containing protein [Gallionella sp.]
MIVKKHLRFSFIAILILFALNFAVNFWSSLQKGTANELLQQATSRQALTTAIKQDTADIQKQVDRLGEIRLDGAATPLPAEEIEKMKRQSAAISAQIGTLLKISDGETYIRAAALQKSHAELAASWRAFYESFGVNHVQALTELALHSEPLSKHVLHEAIPQLEELENRQIAAAREQLGVLQWWSDRIALGAFGISLLAAALIAWLVYRRVAKGLNALQQGAKSIYNGDTGHRIALHSKDELGEIADSFNNLTGAFHTTQTQRAALEQELALRSTEIEQQRQVSKSLLNNILPATVAEEFRTKGSVAPKYLEDVTIVFTDFVGFSSSAETLAADELVMMLHDYFSAFDEIAARYGLEKLKTIGDSYMCAGGLPERNPSHPVDAVMAAMEIVRAVTERSGNRRHNLAIRVGIHTGHVIAGIVGKQKFAYDIWGESVNFASRVESSSAPNRIALSGQTYLRVKDFFECEKQTKSNPKVAKDLELYFVKGFLPSLIDDSRQVPPAPFVRRYHSYFQKSPPSFPQQYASSATGNHQKHKAEVTN